MNPNNLGIIFGPTLIRPSSGMDIPITCLMDSGYQAQAVEFLINNYEKLFGMDELPSSVRQNSGEEQLEADRRGNGDAHCTSPVDGGHVCSGTSDLDVRPSDGLNLATEEETRVENTVYSRAHFSRQPVKIGRSEPSTSQENDNDSGDEHSEI